MTQLGIDFEQREHLERVSSKIAKSVLAFCRHAEANVQQGPDGRDLAGIFYGEQLRMWVRDRTGIAPDSAGRILRDLRQRGVIDYQVLDRRASLYCVTRVCVTRVA
jgi:hypothetical protein